MHDLILDPVIVTEVFAVVMLGLYLLGSVWNNNQSELAERENPSGLDFCVRTVIGVGALISSPKRSLARQK